MLNLHSNHSSWNAYEYRSKFDANHCSNTNVIVVKSNESRNTILSSKIKKSCVFSHKIPCDKFSVVSVWVFVSFFSFVVFFFFTYIKYNGKISYDFNTIKPSTWLFGIWMYLTMASLVVYVIVWHRVYGPECDRMREEKEIGSLLIPVHWCAMT